MADARKTFKEYLLEGGVKNRYFRLNSYFYKGAQEQEEDKRTPLNCTIKIVNIVDGRGSGAVVYQLPRHVIESMNFETAYGMKEATQRQIQSFKKQDKDLEERMKNIKTV